MRTVKDKFSQLPPWAQKLGIWGFLFFLVKGLLWLALGYWVFK